METIKNPADLRKQWSDMGMYEGGIDYEKPDPPSGAEGLTVVELKPETFVQRWTDVIKKL